MLIGSPAAGTESSSSSVMGRPTLPAYREDLNYRVIPAEQGKPVSLPAKGKEAARLTTAMRDMRGERKRMPLCNGADTG